MLIYCDKSFYYNPVLLYLYQTILLLNSTKGKWMCNYKHLKVWMKDKVTQHHVLIMMMMMMMMMNFVSGMETCCFCCPQTANRVMPAWTVPVWIVPLVLPISQGTWALSVSLAPQCPQIPHNLLLRMRWIRFSTKKMAKSTGVGMNNCKQKVFLDKHKTHCNA